MVSPCERYVAGIQPGITLTNTYDALGNRISLDDDAGATGGTMSFAHDAVGRLERLTMAAGAAFDVAYDPAGRITDIAYPNTVASTVQYDLEGR